jgi:hypothetical protein
MGRDDEIRTTINEIYEIKQQLVDLGFEADEVEYIIHENADQKRLSQWDFDTVQKIKEALSSQLSISRGCLELVQKRNRQKAPTIKQLAES